MILERRGSSLIWPSWLREKIVEVQRADLPKSVKRERLDKIDQDGKAYKYKKSWKEMQEDQIEKDPILSRSLNMD